MYEISTNDAMGGFEIRVNRPPVIETGKISKSARVHLAQWKLATAAHEPRAGSAHSPAW
jgi:hypothetical protein